MTINVAINGYGRIGRNGLHTHDENRARHDMRTVKVDGNHLVVDGDRNTDNDF